MIWRGTAQYLKYDAENRIVKVSTDSAGQTYIVRTSYDGDGRRVKRVDSYGTIHYAGPHYERKSGRTVPPRDTGAKRRYNGGKEAGNGR